MLTELPLLNGLAYIISGYEFGISVLVYKYDFMINCFGHGGVSKAFSHPAIWRVFYCVRRCALS